MVDMRMMARRVVLFTNVTAMLAGFALYMTWVILPTFYQLPSGLPPELQHLAAYGFGTSVTVAGLWMLPTSFSLLAAGPLAGLYGARHGSRAPLVAGMLLVAAGSAGIAAFHAEPWQPATWFILVGVGHRLRLRRHAQADRRRRPAHRDRRRHRHEHRRADGRGRHRRPDRRGAAGGQRRPGHRACRPRTASSTRSGSAPRAPWSRRWRRPSPARPRASPRPCVAEAPEREPARAAGRPQESPGA